MFGIDSNQIYLIDFGFCKSYISNKQHIPVKKITKIIGSPNYVSIYTHEHCELSRRDDLESLGYILYYLYYGELDWSSILLTNDLYQERNYQIRNLKRKILQKEDLPHFLNYYFMHVRQLNFEEKPDYLFLRNMLINENLKY